MGCPCPTADFRIGQPFPTRADARSSGIRLNEKNLNYLVDRDGDADLYYYIVRTVELDNGKFVQKGCGPNWEGGRITLCTCKLSMCANREKDDWKGVWIAGIAGAKAKKKGRGYLVYMMKIKKAYDSHSDIYWAARREPRVIPLSTIQKKRTDRNPVGDVYVPQRHRKLKGDARFVPANYVKPINSKRHKHPHLKEGEWRRDIRRKPVWNRHPCLLVGDPHFSFLWNSPKLHLTRSKLARGNKETTLSVFLSKLR